MRPFHKQYLSPRQLVEQMVSRGLFVDDSDCAERYVKSIGYYRISAYLHPLLEIPKQEHRFKVGATFEQALDMYRFDRQLRLLIFNQIEKIEIAVRSAIVNVTSHETGNIFWMTDSGVFADSTKFQGTLEILKTEYDRSREDFVEHFHSTYSDPFPPAWILAEILPLGTLTKIYDNIASNQVRKKIAQTFDLNVPVFISWMTIITVTRNSCCHHARIWNRTWSLRALTMRNTSHPWISPSIPQGKIFFTLCIIKYFIDVIVPNNDMTVKLQQLFDTYPNIDITAMGFPLNWKMEPLWQ